MIFCFDVDGTITARPDIFAPMMKALKESGHTVYPLTGTIQGTDQTPEESRYKQLSSYGLEKRVHYDDVVVCVGDNFEHCGKLKGDFCRQTRVDFMIDDVDVFIAEIRKRSPKTLCLKMSV